VKEIYLAQDGQKTEHKLRQSGQKHDASGTA